MQNGEKLHLMALSANRHPGTAFLEKRIAIVYKYDYDKLGRETGENMDIPKLFHHGVTVRKSKTIHPEYNKKKSYETKNKKFKSSNGE